MSIEELKINGLLGWVLKEYEVSGGLVLYFVFFALAGIAAYLLGSVNFGLLISRINYKDDIRKHGSGNAGMTNMMRTYGKKAAALTLLGDALKGAVAVLFGTLCCGTTCAYFAALCCVIGHAYPIFFGFKGGKGVVVTAVSVLCLDPLLFLILFALFVLIVATTKYISLGSVMCMLVYPLLLSNLQSILHPTVMDTTELIGVQIGAGRNAMVLLAFLNAAFVIWLHRSNIRRLYEGTENKFSFKKSVPKAAQGSVADGAEPISDADADETDESRESDEDHEQTPSKQYPMSRKKEKKLKKSRK